MFDIGSYEVLIIAVVILLVVGPKDLPVFLRTVGQYMGAIKRQANEFRQQFDDAIKDSELDQLRKDVKSMKSDVEGSIRNATRDIEDDVIEAQKAIKAPAKSSAAAADPLADPALSPSDKAEIDTSVKPEAEGADADTSAGSDKRVPAEAESKGA